MTAFRDVVSQCIETGSMKVVEDSVTCDQIPLMTAKEERSGNRALLFNNLVDYRAQVVSNLFGQQKRIFQAFAVKSLPRLFAHLDAAIAKTSSIKSASQIPGGYTVIDRPDITKILPLMTYCQEDGGPYLTSGIVLVTDPQTERSHLCVVRMAIGGKNRLICNPVTQRIRKIVDLTVGRNQPLEVAILIGAPVELMLTACMSMPDDVDELSVAATMAGAEVSVTTDGALFPAEFVIKGTLIPEYEPEGPFGDLKGLYSFKRKNPACVIEEVITRDKPLFHSISAGTAKEHIWLVTMGARYFLEKLKQEFPYFIRYTLPFFAGGRLAILVMREDFRRDEFVEKLWDIPIARLFVLVNRDVNLRSATDVLWAITQRAKDTEDVRFSDRKHPVFQERKIAIDTTVSDLSLWDNRRIAVYQPQESPNPTDS